MASETNHIHFRLAPGQREKLNYLLAREARVRRDNSPDRAMTPYFRRLIDEEYARAGSAETESVG